MSDIYEDITSALYKALKSRKISSAKFDELKKKAEKNHEREAIEAAIRDYKNPDYKGPNTAFKRIEGTHEAYGIGSWAKHSIKSIDKLKKEQEEDNNEVEAPEKVEEEFGTSIAGAFGVTPNDVIGRPTPFKKESKNKQKRANLGYKYQKIRSKNNINEEIDMEKIVESLLEAGIDEDMINRVLDVIEEEYVCEATVGALARAAANNVKKRKAEADAAIKGYHKAADEYEEEARKHPEEEPALYRKFMETDKAACKAVDKANHAEDLVKLNLPKNSKVNANKPFRAAHKVDDKREKELDDVIGTKESKKFLRGMDRAIRKNDIINAEPVKSRVVEAYDEVIEVISSLLEADLPGFIEDMNRAKRNKEYIDNVKRTIATEKKNKEQAKNYKRESLLNLIKNVKRDKKTLGPKV